MTNARNILERFCWTAIQAFVGSLPATFTLTGNNLRAVAYSGLTAAVAAVISLAKNLTLTTPVVTPVPVTSPHPAPVLPQVPPLNPQPSGASSFDVEKSLDATPKTVAKPRRTQR